MTKTSKQDMEKYWARLEVNPDHLDKHPEITPILINSLGSIPKVIEYLRGSDAKEAIELVRLWDIATPKERKSIPFEGYCLAAKSNPKQMIGIIMQTIVEQSNLASEFLVAVAHPEIIKKTIKLAKTTKGYDERKAILQNRGFLPAPKNTVFNNFGSVSQDNRKQIANISTGQIEGDAGNITEAMDSFEAQRKLKAPDEIIDVEVRGVE